MFGAHLSIAGGLHNALLEAQRFAMDCVQIFTKNQRQWKVAPLRDEQINAWHEHRRAAGDMPVIAHVSYLINLASTNRDTRSKSIGLLIDEIERAAALDIGQVVMHPGAHLGAGRSKGLGKIVSGLNRVHRATRDCAVTVCLENTAGQGTTLGAELADLRHIIDHVAEPRRLGVCIDTAHALAAGYDLASGAGAQRFIAELDEVIGLAWVRVLHVNDSKTPRGGRTDRHEHIGRGHVALRAFAALIHQRHLRLLPKILESPKGTAPDGRPWDAVNLQTIRNLKNR